MSRLNQRLMASVERAHVATLESMAKDAAKLCLEAAKTKETKNRTGAQLNSYVWMVCYNGIVKAVGDNEGLKKYDYEARRSSKRWGHAGLEGTWWEESLGDEWIQPFFDALGKPLSFAGTKAGKAKGYEIYIINAAYYSGWLEQGNQNSPINFHKYRIVSQIKNDCETVANKYAKELHTHARVERLGVGYTPFKPASFNTKSEQE